MFVVLGFAALGTTLGLSYGLMRWMGTQPPRRPEPDPVNVNVNLTLNGNRLEPQVTAERTHRIHARPVDRAGNWPKLPKGR